jgi:hypothetical protein
MADPRSFLGQIWQNYGVPGVARLQENVGERPIWEWLAQPEATTAQPVQPQTPVINPVQGPPRAPVDPLGLSYVQNQAPAIGAPAPPASITGGDLTGVGEFSPAPLPTIPQSPVAPSGGKFSKVLEFLSRPDVSQGFLQFGANLGAGQDFGQALGGAGQAIQQFREAQEAKSVQEILQDQTLEHLKAQTESERADAAYKRAQARGEGAGNFDVDKWEADHIMNYNFAKNQISSLRDLGDDSKVLSESGALNKFLQGSGAAMKAAGFGDTDVGKFVTKYNRMKATILEAIGSHRITTVTRQVVDDLLKDITLFTSAEEVRLAMQEMMDRLGSEVNQIEGLFENTGKSGLLGITPGQRASSSQDNQGYARLQGANLIPRD